MVNPSEFSLQNSPFTLPFLVLDELNCSSYIKIMKIDYTYWTEEDGTILGYLNEYPDHWTQGKDLEDLKEHLLDLHKEFSGDTIPGIRKVGQLEVA